MMCEVTVLIRDWEGRCVNLRERTLEFGRAK